MTRKRMLAMVKTKKASKLIEATELPKSFFPRSLKTRRNQHSKFQVPLKQTKLMKDAFQAEEIENKNPQHLIDYISNLLYLERKHFIDSSFIFYVNPVIDDKVNVELRDYTVKNIQIMNKVFFELPTEIFVKASTLVDRFLTRVKVKPKYMACVATACFYIAAKTAAPDRVSCPPLETLSQLSKCGGTFLDLERMVDIIMNKLNHNFEFVTSYDFLNFFYKIRAMERPNCWLKLLSFLEIAQTSLKICCQKPSVVALACLLMNHSEDDKMFVKAMCIACKIDLATTLTTSESLKNLYQASYSRQPSSRNSLVWAISKRTLSNIYGSSRSSLVTISEEENNCSSNRGRNEVLINEDWSSSLGSLFEF